jgi:uncharacterized protein (DUF983 family)
MSFAHPTDAVTEPPRSWAVGMRRGAGGRCPNCGDGAVFDGYRRDVPQRHAAAVSDTV